MDGYFSKKTLEEIKNKNNIVDVIKERVNITGSNGKYHGHCPFCDSKYLSLAVSEKEQVYACVDCGEAGDVCSFIMKTKGISFNDSVKYLAERASLSVPHLTEAKNRETERETIYEINREAAKYFIDYLKSENGRPGRDYFGKRELTQETITKFGLGYKGYEKTALYKHLVKKGFTKEQIENAGLINVYNGSLHDQFNGRVIFPIIDENKHVVAFSGRLLKESENDPKYLNTKETLAFDKKRTLFGFNIAKDHMQNGVIICEGNMDVISLHQAGFNNAVAALGTAFSSDHADILSYYTDTAHLAFDNDTAGVNAVLKSIPVLMEAGIKTDVIDLAPFKDPDELIKAKGQDFFAERINTAKDAVFYDLQNWLGTLDINTVKTWPDIIEPFAKKLFTVPNKEEYIDAINAILGESDSAISVSPVPMEQKEYSVGRTWVKEMEIEGQSR